MPMVTDVISYALETAETPTGAELVKKLYEAQGVERPEITRGLISGAEVRAIDEGERTATFIAATETGVDTWQGREHLRIAGVKLQRFRANPVVLDSHNRYEAGAVIGRAHVTKENRALVAEVTFAETARAEEIWQLVKGKFIRAVSVGFIPQHDTMIELQAGETNGEGDAMIEGPARIIRNWELFEISVVPVPADPNALRRAFMEKGFEIQLDPLARALVSNINRLTGGNKQEGNDMAEKETPPATETPQAGNPQETDERLADVAVIRAVLAEAPKELREMCIADGVTLDEARARYRAYLTEHSQPVGTPAQPTETVQTENQPKRTVEEIDNRALAQTIGAL